MQGAASNLDVQSTAAAKMGSLLSLFGSLLAGGA
jgi:hypothetical protein